MYAIKRTDDEISDVLNKALDGQDQGSLWPGMSYEQGIDAFATWLFGDTDENPMADYLYLCCGHCKHIPTTHPIPCYCQDSVHDRVLPREQDPEKTVSGEISQAAGPAS